MKSYQDIANDTERELTENRGWVERYNKYYNDINPDSSKAKYVAEVVKSFRCENGLTKYTSIGRVMNSSKVVNVDLRINGHSVAAYKTMLTGEVKKAIDDDIPTKERRKIIRESSSIEFHEEGLNEVASSDSLFKEVFSDLAEKYKSSTVKWNSKEATEFRRVMKGIESKSTHSEHTIESHLLKRLSSKKSAGKPILGIQPIILCGAYFQLVTPLKASDVEEKDIVAYSKDKNGIDRAGGGIDILARIKNQNNMPELCVIELKDNYTDEEKPTKAIKQAIAYATFLDRLIRSDQSKGDLWYKKILTKNSTIKEQIKINAVIAMPYREDGRIIEEDRELAGKKINLKTGDIIELHYLFFDKKCLYDDDMKVTCSLQTYKKSR